MRFGVRAMDIRNWNNIPFGRNIIAGKTLVIHRGKNATPSSPDEEPVADVAPKKARISESAKQADDARETPDNTIRYVVKRGETLWDIARMHNAPMEQIKAQNGIVRSKIYAGQVLFIPVNNRTN